MTSYAASNRDLTCFLVTKHSWKGKYKRIFSVGDLAITTYNPTSLEITNQWLYEEFINIKRTKSSQDNRFDEFTITVKKKLKNDNMIFSSEFAKNVVTEALKQYSKFNNPSFAITHYTGKKHNWADDSVDVMLRVCPSGVERLDSHRKIVIASYDFMDIMHISHLENNPNGLILEMGEQRRRHCFIIGDRDKFILDVRRNSLDYICMNIQLAKDPIALDIFNKTRLGLCSRDDQITSFVEFSVEKHTPRHERPPRRTLCLSETCLIERDPSSYAVICARPLKNIVCLIRDLKNPQMFSIQYNCGQIRSYSSTERDLVLASIIDGTRSAKNQQIHVLTCGAFEKSVRLIPNNCTIDDEGEQQLLKHIVNPPANLSRYDLFKRFNYNIPYNGFTHVPTTGIFNDSKTKTIVECVKTVLNEKYTKDEINSTVKVQAQMQCLRRLFSSKAGFQSFTDVAMIRTQLGSLVVDMLKFGNDTVDYVVVEMLTSLMQPMHANYELRYEQSNKNSLLSSKQFIEHLLNLVVNHVERKTGFLVIASMLDFLTYALCAPYSETTSGESFDMLLIGVAKRGKSFYKLFHNSSMTIIKGAGMVMRAIIEESDQDMSERMQMLSLTEGAFLKHLQLSLLIDGRDLRVLTNRQLSGQLISLWIANNEKAMDLMKRCLPRGLLDGLYSKEKAPVREGDYLSIRNNLEIATNEQKKSNIREQLDQVQIQIEAKLDGILQHWNLQHKMTILQELKNRREDEKKREKPVVLRKRRQQIKADANWKYFAYMFKNDWSKSDLIWNEKTRAEFKNGIENEMRLMELEMEQVKDDVPISWNHTEFYVKYDSLKEEIKIGDYYLRILLNEEDNTATDIKEPSFFFNNVYHKFLLAQKSELKCYCLKAMAVTYGRHHETIGPFPDSCSIVEMLQNTKLMAERDHLVFLLSKLALNKENCRDLIGSDLLYTFVDFATLAHLHTSRATSTNQSNLLESAKLTEEDEENVGAIEWAVSNYEGSSDVKFNAKQMERMFKEGKITGKSKVWADGMSDWASFEEVAQFKWTVVYKSSSNALYNPSQLCEIVLDTMISMCQFFPARDEDGSIIRPLPNVKRVLSEPILLYQIVQLLLTYDPSIVHRVATLLLLVMQDNPFISRLYLSGVFFFIMMYNSSNILPVAKFLHYTHTKQAFTSIVGKSELIARSILSPILPEAAIYYLEEYGAEKYAEVFIGEQETPELIWNSEMKRSMIEKVSFHVSDYTLRLKSNIKSLYRYCPLTPIAYPQLEGELFCYVYYLRHLCDTKRFPNYPIRDPIEFLKSCLAAWHEEIERKPAEMSMDAALTILGLKPSEVDFKDTDKIKKAYRRLALMLHPDKNEKVDPAKFQELGEAYVLVMSHIETMTRNDGEFGVDSDIQRIVLCLKAQSIIYSRHVEELGPYKYSGYGQLIKTIELESKEKNWFATGDGKLLVAAVELCYWTLKSSPLNAEQLRRDGGLEIIYQTFCQCVDMIGMSSKVSDLCVQVCYHLCKCFATAAEFELCREKIAEMHGIFRSIVRLLQYTHLPKLSVAAGEVCCSFAVCTLLQTQLFQNGVLWQLLPHLFKYDYTLEEGGVAHSEESNEQTRMNNLALESCEALACLAGFREGKPENDGIINSLKAMLTPYICRLMRQGDNTKVLKTLTTNTEDPYLIWDNATRAELLDFVEGHRLSSVSASDLFGAEFRMSIYAQELIVGEIFVRVYNEQPNFVLYAPKESFMDIICYLKKNINELKPQVVKKQMNGDLIDFEEVLNEPPSIVKSKKKKELTTVQKIEMVLTALSNIMTTNQAIEMLLIGNMDIIFEYINLNGQSNIQQLAMKVISIAAGNKECVTEIAKINQLPKVLIMLKQLTQSTENILQLLIALASNGNVVKDALEYGGLLYFFHILCDSAQQKSNRILAAELLAKLQADKLNGQRWSLLITRYLPPYFASTLCKSPSNSITMFDSNTENPELIWNDEVRSDVKNIINEQLIKFYNLQLENIESKFNTNLPSIPFYYQEILNDEVIVADVFIRLFVANPSWPIGQPRKFATTLFHDVLELLKKPSQHLDILTTALCLLIMNHPNVADLISTQGYFPQFVNAMSTYDGPASKGAMQVLDKLCENNFCNDAVSDTQIIKGILHCMKKNPASNGESGHALKLLLKRNTPRLAQQVHDSGIVQHILGLLNSSLPEVENPAASKAEMVDALKSVLTDLTWGKKIQDILDASPIWAQYRDQRHDLFLPATRTQAIAGPPPSSHIAGALTFGNGPPSMPNRQPPPYDGPL
uniref:J domain-containing protein n=1 Tax=Rhabditophanes sp. KR3021 TaxID=114890 RepID=A0AC35U0N7_9BILA